MQWPSNSVNIFGIHYDTSTPDQSAFLRTWQAGELLDPKNIPARLVLAEGRPAPKGDLFALTHMVMAISERFADLLRQFNLGPAPTADNPRPRRTELHPMPLFAHDERTLIRKVVLMQCSAQQEGFVPKESKGAEFLGQRWFRPLATPYQIAVRQMPKDGLDFWRDPSLVHTWFCSDRLYHTMKAAGIKPPEFYHCRMAD